jgi:hypothetical protein
MLHLCRAEARSRKYMASYGSESREEAGYDPQYAEDQLLSLCLVVNDAIGGSIMTTVPKQYDLQVSKSLA